MTDKISIIIPCKGDSDYLKECIKHCKQLDYPDYEIIVIPDKWFKLSGVQMFAFSGGPAGKRDYGVKKSKGNIIAFIDDDAFPEKDWLKNSVKYFNKGYVAVGGPAVTPPNVSLLEKAGGLVLSSPLMGGLNSRYESVGKPVEIDDWPTVNFLIKTSVFNKVGGFSTHYYPGEDTKLCLDIINLGEKIVYGPDVRVFHHRRPLFKKHLKQISNYGLHRGLFVKKFPKTSFKLSYFIPSLLLSFILFGGIMSIINTVLLIPYFSIILLYFSLCLLSGIIISKNITIGILVMFGIITTHLYYGLFFIKGLIVKKVVR